VQGVWSFTFTAAETSALSKDLPYDVLYRVIEKHGRDLKPL